MRTATSTAKPKKQTTRQQVTALMHPNRLNTSGKMTAILAYVLGESWTEPEIASLSTTSDGYVVGISEFIGDASDVIGNLRGVADAVGLDAKQRAWFFAEARSTISGLGRFWN